MTRFCLPVLVLLFTGFSIFAQTADSVLLPYREIPDPPADYSSGNILSRTVDGVGFRYYWATEGLTEEDLIFTPGQGNRNTLETLIHIYGLSETLVNTHRQQPNIRPASRSSNSLDTLRQRTLENLRLASELSRGKTAGEIAELKIIFQSGERSSEFDYWNMLNGPVADILYHTGQIVTFRRLSGNPINPKVNVFMGKLNP